jgi:hypothetical protein
MKTEFHLSMLFLSPYFMHILHEKMSNPLPHLSFIISAAFPFRCSFKPHIETGIEYKKQKKEQKI